MTYQELIDICGDVTYKPDWQVVYGQMGVGYYVQWLFTAPCHSTGTDGHQSGRKWYVSPFSTRSEVVQTLLKAVLTAEEHEARECFKYKSIDIFAPHMDVEEMVRRRMPQEVRS